MAALVPTDTHPIDESCIETKPQTSSKESKPTIGRQKLSACLKS